MKEDEVVTSATPGSMDVVRLMSCVKTVASSMCQVVRNIGKGKSNVSNTLLLNKIIEHDTKIQNEM